MDHAEAIMQKGRLGFAYEAIADAEVKQAVCREFARLMDENQVSDKTLIKHLATAILPAVAVYHGLQAHGHPRNEAMKLVRSSVLEAAQPMAKSFQKLARLPFFFSLFGFMCKLSMKTAFRSGGWEMRWNAKEQGVISWDCHKCFYVEVLNRLGTPELCKIFCESDDVMYGHIPGARWARRKTIGRGAEICDFRFYKENV